MALIGEGCCVAFVYHLWACLGLLCGWVELVDEGCDVGFCYWRMVIVHID